MKLSYNSEAPTEEAKTLGAEIVKLILSSGVTYGQADAALTEAQRLLYEATRPVRCGLLRRGDSESKS